MKYICSLILFFSLAANAQESAFILHPLVGDTITRASKNKYLLFPEVKDSVFDFCNIKIRGGKYFVKTHFINDSVSENEIQVLRINEYRENIDKLNEYYVNKANQDTNAVNQNMQTNPGTVNKSIAAPPLTEQQKSEIERDARLKSDQERMNNYQQGTETAPASIEISTGKKKKK